MNILAAGMCEIPVESSFIKTLKAWLGCNVAVCIVLDVFGLSCSIGLYMQTYMKCSYDVLNATSGH